MITRYRMKPRAVIVHVFRIAMRLASENELRRMNHFLRHPQLKEQANIVRMVIGNRIRQLVPCTVTMTRIGKKPLDGDNLQGALKHIRDAVAERIGVDDADPRITWAYAQDRGGYAVRVEVTANTPKST